MLKLLYDLTATQPSPQSKFHGGGLYGEVVFFKLLECIENIVLSAVYDSRSYINPDILTAAKKCDVRLYDIQYTSIREIIHSENIDRAYSAMLNLNQDWPLGEIELFTTVHGLRTLEMPSDPTMIRYETSLIQKLKDIIFITIGKKIFLKKMYEINARLVADGRIHVITISNHSLASIKSFYPQLRDKEIPVFASPSFAQINGYTADTPNDIIKLSQFAIEQNKYFLVTSAARWIKNVWRTVRALDSFFTDGFAPDYKAVITGVTNKRIFTYGLKNVSRFIFLDYIHRSTLALLTSHAYAFIYPSLNEGFGYPPIESMKYGIPVAASGTSSIPEICGDAVLYFDPHSVTEIKNRLVQLLDKSVYSELKQKSQIQYKKISLMQKNDLQRLVKYIIE